MIRLLSILTCAPVAYVGLMLPLEASAIVLLVTLSIIVGCMAVEASYAARERA